MKVWRGVFYIPERTDLESGEVLAFTGDQHPAWIVKVLEHFVCSVSLDDMPSEERVDPLARNQFPRAGIVEPLVRAYDGCCRRMVQHAPAVTSAAHAVGQKVHSPPNFLRSIAGRQLWSGATIRKVSED